MRRSNAGGPRWPCRPCAAWWSAGPCCIRGTTTLPAPSTVRYRCSRTGGRQMVRKKLAAGLLVAPLLILAACTSGGANNAGGTTAGGSVCSYTFEVITHGDNGNFWSVVYKGASKAASDVVCKRIVVYGALRTV